MKSFLRLFSGKGKALLLGAAFCAAAPAAFATHLMGGEIVINHISGNSYQVQLTHYRDMLGVTLSTQVSYQIITADANGYPTVLHQSNTLKLDSALSTSLLPNSPYDIEVGVYLDTVQLLNPGTYWIAATECCRNHAIGNITNPGSEAFGLVTEFKVLPTGVNSSPRFLTTPVPYFNDNYPVSYNPLPYDPDGDSLVWSLNVPRTNVAWSASNPNVLGQPVTGFTTPPSDPANPFTMNPISGNISWTPNTLGNFVQSFLVDEYRNGVRIGSSVRDYQYIVVPKDTNFVPALRPSSNVQYNSAANYYYVEYTPGQPVSFSIAGSVNTPVTTLEMTSHSALFLSGNLPQFTVNSTGPNNVTGTFSWTPAMGFRQTIPVVMRATNGYLVTDFTVMLKPSATSTAVTSVAKPETKLYPNPTKGSFTLEYSGEASTTVSAHIYNPMGQQVARIYEGKATEKMVLSFNETLAKGLYFVRIQSNWGKAEVVPFVVE